MILVDSRIGSCELIPHIRRACNNYIPVEETNLEFGDVCFEGNGSEGRIAIGIERKTLQDILNCIQDARYIDQRRGMLNLYQKSFLLIEGRWQPNYKDGTLMEGKPRR